MSVRRDTAILNVKINGQDASKTYGELIGKSRRLKGELYKLTPGTDAFIQKTRELKQVNTRLAKIRKDAFGVRSAWQKMLPTLSVVGAIAGLNAIKNRIISLGKESLKFFDIQSKVNAQTNAVLKSTGGIAGRTFEQIKGQAQDLQKVTLVGDEQVQ